MATHDSASIPRGRVVDSLVEAQYRNPAIATQIITAKRKAENLPLRRKPSLEHVKKDEAANPAKHGQARPGLKTTSATQSWQDRFDLLLFEKRLPRFPPPVLDSTSQVDIEGGDILPHIGETGRPLVVEVPVFANEVLSLPPKASDQIPQAPMSSTTLALRRIRQRLKQIKHPPIPPSSYSKPAFVLYDLYLPKTMRPPEDQSIIMIKMPGMAERREVRLHREKPVFVRNVRATSQKSS